MRFIRTTHEQVVQKVQNLIQLQQEAFVYCVAEAPCAVVGTNGHADIEKAAELGIKVIRINHEGGCIVTNTGDVDVGIFTKGYYGHQIRDTIISKLVTLLSADGIEAAIMGNDLIVEGHKVLGFGSRMYGEILYTAMHISINTNLELIRQICTKPMEKIPGSLSEYGITAEDVVNILMETIKMYE